MKASILTIGDEILIGQIVDTNSAWIATELNLLGIDIDTIITVSDTREGILEGLEQAAKNSQLILITGGLGPTKDDITKKVLAEYFDDTLVFNEENWNLIQRIFEKYGRSTTEAHKAQCYLPSKATILQNKMGTAPGLLMEKDGIQFVSMPGVPYEMKYIMTHGVIPKLKATKSNINILHKTIKTVGEGESRIAKKIEDIVDSFPPFLKMAYLPSIGSVRLRISGKHENATLLEQEISHFQTQITDRLGNLVYGYEGISLAEAVGKLCIEKQKTIGIAESCTGGVISQMITAIPGSSAYFQGSVIAYSNDIKNRILNVPSNTLESHGAVSEQTVKSMVTGALHTLRVDIAVAVSGIAGPGGGTIEKPVGTIWVACGNKENIITQRLQLGKDRLKNIEYTSVFALNMLRLFLLD